MSEPTEPVYTEDDLRLAFEAGNRLGWEEAALDEGYALRPNTERALTWEQYVTTVRALRSHGRERKT